MKLSIKELAPLAAKHPLLSCAAFGAYVAVGTASEGLHPKAAVALGVVTATMPLVLYGAMWIAIKRSRPLTANPTPR